MAYTKQTWTDGPAGGTPMSAARLGHLEDGVAAAAVIADLGTPGTPTGDAVKVALGSLTPLNRGVIFAGDSVTAGANGDGNSMPLAYARRMLNAPVFTRAYPGETSDGVALHRNGLPLKFTVTGGSIPASGSVAVTPVIPSDAFASLFYGAWTAGGVPDGRRGTGRLAGVLGTLDGSPGAYTFTRSFPGDAPLPVAGAVPFVDDFEATHRDHNLIIMTGRNNTSSAARTLAATAAMLAYQQAGDYIVLSVTTRTDESTTQNTSGYNAVLTINAALSAAHGAHYFDLRGWLIANGLSAVALTATTADTAAITANTLPPSLMSSDGMHPNAYGYTAMGKAVAAFAAARGWGAYTEATDDGVPVGSAVSSAGVDTYSHRWIANRATVADGAPVPSLADQGPGAVALTQATTSAQPTLHKVGSDGYLTFDGVDDTVSAAFTQAVPFAFAMVLRRTGTSAKTAIDFLTGATQGVLQGTVDVRNGNTLALTATSGDGNWFFYAGVINGANSVTVYNNTSITGDAGTSATSIAGVQLGNGAFEGIGFLGYDVAEVIIWPSTLTAGQLTGTVRPAMQAAHPALSIP